jgi:hypothetical protein
MAASIKTHSLRCDKSTAQDTGAGIDSAGDTGQYPGWSAAAGESHGTRHLKIPLDAL